MTWEEAVISLKSDESQKQLVMDSYFDDPIEKAAERFYQSYEWKKMQEILSTVVLGTALDLGAGRGISTYALTKDGWEVTAIEPDKSEIVGSLAIRNLLNKTNLKAEILESYGEALPFKDESFDLVYMRQALHHANDIQKLCKEVFRVLKKGGVFIASREHVIDNQNSKEKFLELHPLHHLYGGENAFKLSEYKQAISQSGLEMIKVIYPYSNNINLAPLSIEQIKVILKRKTGIPFPRFLVTLGCKILDYFYKQPGRLFTFICQKS